MSEANERARSIDRFTESLIAGEPDMTLVTEDFEYEQHFGSTEGLYVGEAGYPIGTLTPNQPPSRQTKTTADLQAFHKG